MLDKKTASHIWNCIQCHEGYVEHFGEWCEYLEIDEDDVWAFETMVSHAVESLPERVDNE